MHKNRPTKSERSLAKYREKRDPSRTNEPFGPEPTRSPATGGTMQGEFVVHLHDATRRHHDLRIEVGGVLESFAIPRGPSLDPKDKRLAVQTEPHPIEYLEFEDVIPEGNYGAGSMIAWDRGRVRYLEKSAEDGIAAGKVDFELYGLKLRGRFALVKTSGRGGREDSGQPQWLLLKKKDAFSTDRDVVETEPRSILSGLTVEELPRRDEIVGEVIARAVDLGAPARRVDARRMTPMLCTLVDPDEAALEAKDWYYELKLDGVRIVADKQGDDVSLTYRTRRPAGTAYPEIVRAVRALAPERLVLDGEIVAFDEQGRPDFQKLARRIHVTRPQDVLYAMRAVPVVYVVFDLLAIGDRDLRDLPLSARKELLARVVPGKGFVRMLDHVEGDGQRLFDLCRANHLEGIVGKRASSKYHPGPRRTRDWIKVKCERDDDFVVVGWTRGERGRDRLGAIDIASWEGDRLVARGKVGSGLAEETIEDLRERMKGLEIDACAAEGELLPAPRGRTFVRPELVVRVRYMGWSEDARLRHPVFAGVRDDVDVKSCTAAPHGDDAVLAIAEPAGASAVTTEADRTVGKRRVALTNQSKVFWPDDGLTKGDLCSYYEAIAPALLPYLKDRPVVLVRYPDGIAGKSFYQWNLPAGTPSWVRAMPLRTEADDHKDVQTFLVDDVDTLLYIANLGCIPLHVLAARAEHLDQCDFLTIDFDLGGRPISDGVALALTLREILDAIGLEGFPKTSGQTGLHVLVPLGPGATFDTARTLADLLASLVHRKHHDISTMERVKKKRGGRVYIDTGQTGKTRTIVAPYSARAVQGAGVSTPLTWDEVGFALDPRRFTIVTVPARVKERGDPMAGMLAAKPDLASAVGKLGALVAR